MKKKLAIAPWLILVGVAAGCGGGMEASNNVAGSADDPASGAPREGIYCEAVEQRVSPEDCEDLTRADAEVRPGAAAFNVPDPMRRGETFEVHLVIDRRSPKEIRVIEEPQTYDPSGNISTGSNVQDPGPAGEDPAVNAASSGEGGGAENTVTPAAEDPPPTPGQIVEPLAGKAERFFPPVGRHMRAELVGEGFEIASKTEASQEIPLGGQASWVWSVTARKGGTQSLTLVTVVEGVADGRRFVLARTPRVRTVTVEVSLRDWIWDVLHETPGWIKAVTAIVVAISGLLTALYALPWRRRRIAAREAAAANTGRGDRPDGDGEEGGPPAGAGPDA